MPRDEIDRVTVLGAGNVGHGIAEVAAVAGYDVTKRDIEEEIVADGYGYVEWILGKPGESVEIEQSPDAVLDRIDTTVDLAEAVDDTNFVIEAGPERMDVKRGIFADLEERAPVARPTTQSDSSRSVRKISGSVRNLMTLWTAWFRRFETIFPCSL